MPNRGKFISCQECATFNCFVKKTKPEWLSQISEFKNQVVYPKGQYIFTEGAPVFGAYFILSGQVKVVSSIFSGKQNIVRLASDGHMLGHKGIGHETYNIGAVALQDSRICFVNNELLYDAFLNNPHFSIEVMMFYSKELRKSETRNKYFAQMTTEEKVAYAILYTYETLHDQDEDGLPCILLSRQELAELAGTNAEQVSRSITVFKSDGLLSPEGRCIKILNIKGFHQLLSPYDQFM